MSTFSTTYLPELAVAGQDVSAISCHICELHILIPELDVAGKNQRHLLSTFSTIYLNWLSLARMSVPFLVNFLNYLPELTFAGKDQRHLLSTFLTFYLNWLSPARISAMDMLAGTIILSTMCTIPLVAIEHGRRITVFFLLTPVFLYKNSIIGKAARG